MSGTRWAGLLVAPTGVPGAVGPDLSGRAALWGPAAVCAGGRRPAREIDHTRAALGVVDLEARPGPAATHRHRGRALRSLRRRPHQWGRVTVRQLYASSRSPARPCRRPLALRQIPPVPSTPVGPGHCSAALRVVSKPSQAPPPPTGTAARPAGALHTGGAWCADVWLGASSRSPAGSRRHPPAPRPGPPVPSNPSNRSALGRESPKTQTTSVKIGEFGVFWARWSAFWAHSGYE